MRDRQEEGTISLSTVPMHRVEGVPVSYRGGRENRLNGIAEILPGGFDVSWQYTSAPWASLSNNVNAAHTTTVPQGTQFFVFVPYYVLWSNKPVLQSAYTIALTVSDGQNADFNDGRVGLSTNGVLSGTFTITCVMPGRANVSFKITPWFNPSDQWNPLTSPPPKPWF